MKLSDMMTVSDSYTDEVLTSGNALKYSNEAVARINTKFSIALPFFADTTTDYDALNESWCRRLYVTYMNYAVKMNDSSLNEAMMYKNEFDIALQEFGAIYLDLLDAEYIGDGNVPGVYQIDTSDAVDSGWFTNNGRGGL